MAEPVTVNADVGHSVSAPIPHLHVWRCVKNAHGQWGYACSCGAWHALNESMVG